MIQARMVTIACGHEDCDDLDALRHDPALKMAARIEALRTRIRVSFPSATPNRPVIAHMLSAMEARAP